MTDLVKDESNTKQSSSNGFSGLLIGLVVIAIVALIAYQTLGCAGCYGASWIK
jgi:hypothetical protein